MRSVLLALLCVAACAERDRCDVVAKTSTASFLAAKADPNLTTLVDVLAPQLEATIRSRCREDGWSKTAVACLERNDPECWSKALTAEQRARFDRALQGALDSVERPRD